MFNNCNNSKAFFRRYIQILNETSKKIDLEKLDKILNILNLTVKLKSNIYVAGNGGSASVANHFFCDFNKGIKITSKKKMMPKVISLTNSIEYLTAVGNDIGFTQIFSSILENYCTKNDCLILFSCSGKSKNVLQAIKMGKKKKIKIILISGFCKKINIDVDVHLDLNCKNYGITEDLFSSIMHMLAQYLRYGFDKKGIL